jgi:competence protein ComFC
VRVGVEAEKKATRVDFFGLFGKMSSALLELIFPRGLSCALCGAELDTSGEILCEDCREKLPPAEGPRCPGCGRRVASEGFCRMCGEYGPVSDGGFASFDYEGAAQSLLIAFKFEDRTGLRELFSRSMADAIKLGGVAVEIDCVVPVPMHWRRKFIRGYNQSALLASWVAEALGRPLVKGVLARPVYTKAVSTTSGGPAARLENAKKSFFPGKGSLAGKKALLVDDILTTGSTVRTCVGILRGMGAKKVYSVVAELCRKRNI